VDDWPASPNRGNVYFVYDNVPPGSSQNQVLFSRSTNQGRTFSKPIKLNDRFSQPFAPDVAVAPDGAIYVLWRQFPNSSGHVSDAVVFVKSTDGGRTFGKRQIVASPLPAIDRSDLAVGNGPVEDCGDGVTLCQSGFVFPRVASLAQATVDAAGRVFVVWEELAPVADNGDSYRPDGQERAVVTRSADGGRTWTSPTPIDPQPTGHQFWPNIEFDKTTGTLAVVYHDSRSDTAYSPYRPPGNRAEATSTCGTPTSSTPCDVMHTYVATSSNGSTWTSFLVSTIGHMPSFEMFADREIPFQGDYLGIDAVGGVIFAAWDDNRDVVPGTDPREASQDGFDVLQCLDPNLMNSCINSGGLDQNIYGAAIG
jgi:hypothetical protein